MELETFENDVVFEWVHVYIYIKKTVLHRDYRVHFTKAFGDVIKTRLTFIFNYDYPLDTGHS